MNLRAAIEKAAGDAEKLKNVRGLLAPFLRDTLVALNYAHYAPPGAQILFTNPLFVRSHDFIGMQGANHTWRATEIYGTGWPSNARRTPGRLARRSAVRAGRGRAEFPDPVPDPGADLGRPGSADDPQRQDSALVERHSGADALGGAAYALRPSRCWPRRPSTRRSREQVLEALSQSRAARPRRAVGATAGAGRREGAPSNESRLPSCSCLRADMAARRRTHPDPSLAEIRRLAAELPTR